MRSKISTMTFESIFTPEDGDQNKEYRGTFGLQGGFFLQLSMLSFRGLIRRH